MPTQNTKCVDSLSRSNENFLSICHDNSLYNHDKFLLIDLDKPNTINDKLNLIELYKYPNVSELYHRINNESTCSIIDRVKKNNKVDNIKDLYSYLIKVGLVFRRGFISSKYFESDATHMYKISAMLMMLDKRFHFKTLDIKKCYELAISHDMAEVAIGDVTPEDKISSKNRHAIEMAVFDHLFSDTSFSYFIDVMSEYNNQKTKEAQLVCFLDKMDFFLTIKTLSGQYPELKPFSMSLEEKIYSVFKEYTVEGHNLYNFIMEHFYKKIPS